MADDDRDGGKMGAFLLGFVLGVLLCLGGGTVFFMRESARAAMGLRQLEEARMEAEVARRAAEDAMLVARDAALREKEARDKAQK
ncbi:MAG: hypothetical protein U0840_17095 [Gemmataceae bacterium]